MSINCSLTYVHMSCRISILNKQEDIMETRKLDTYPTTVNVIVTFEEEEQIIDDVDVTVMFNMYPLNRELD